MRPRNQTSAPPVAKPARPIGVDTRLLYDVLQANHGVIIGIEIGGNP